MKILLPSQYPEEGVKGHSGFSVPQGIPVQHPIGLLENTGTQLTQVSPSTLALLHEHPWGKQHSKDVMVCSVAST